MTKKIIKRLSILLLLLQNVSVPVDCNDVNSNSVETITQYADQTQHVTIMSKKRNRNRNNRILSLEVNICQRIDSTKYTTVQVPKFKVETMLNDNNYKLGSCTADCMLLCYQYDAYKIEKNDCICSGIKADNNNVVKSADGKSPNILRQRVGEKIQKIIDAENFDTRFTTPRTQPSSAPTTNNNDNNNNNMMDNNNNNNNNNGGGTMNNGNGNGNGNGNMNSGGKNNGGNNNSGNNNGGNMNMNSNNGGGGSGNGNGQMNNNNGGNGNSNGNANMNMGGGNGNGNGNGDMNMNSNKGNGGNTMMKNSPTTARPVQSRAPSRERTFFPDGPNGKNQNNEKPNSNSNTDLSSSSSSFLEMAINKDRSPPSSTPPPPNPNQAEQQQQQQKQQQQQQQGGGGGGASSPLDRVDALFQI